MPRWKRLGKPKVPAVSIRGETYQKLKEEAQTQDLLPHQLLEKILAPFLIDQDRPKPKPKPKPKPELKPEDEDKIDTLDHQKARF